MRKNNIFLKSFLGLAFLALAACTNEWDEIQTGQPLREGEASIQWLAPNMGIKHVQTRANDSKTAEEQQINNVHVFIFGQDGEYLTTGANATQCYRYISASQNLVLQTNSFADQDKAGKAIVVAVANVPENTFGVINAQGCPEYVENLQDLKDFEYNLLDFTATLPEGGLPMMGIVGDDGTGVNLSSNAPAASKVILVQMKSLMARIDLNFTMDPYQSSEDGRNPSLRIDEVRVGNFPVGGRIAPQLDNSTDVTAPDIISTLEDPVTVDGLESFVGHILREGEPQELTLYMFEHGRAAKALGEAVDEDGNKIFSNGQYPAGIDESEQQRYKNYLAAGDAAYIELEGVYTNHNNYKYAVTYRLYPGGNATDDFTIKSNCQYKNNITVKGITVNNMGKEALLDTRVDIDSEDNPYFIEMLREREHDAHFCVTPMDVFIYKGGSVHVQILDPDNHTWIRMEPINRAATEAGDGKREYFTTDLLSTLDTDVDSCTSYTVYSNNINQTKEERIYFYIDENVPSESDAEAGREVQARTATLRITYHRPDSETGAIRSHSRDVLIRQAGMVPVKMSELDYQGVIYGEYTFYIESYEEYLEHYDGKDLYNHTYDGLAWGLSGLVTQLGSYDIHEFMPYGWRNTMTIMQQFRKEDEQGKAQSDITLNDKPRSAAEYCYNKNKRNGKGQVEECHWYFPTIREMEHAMDQYYSYAEFNGVFKDNWYWGSNPGPGTDWKNDYNNSRTSTGESKLYARATKSIYKGKDNNGDEKFSHATSEANKPYAKNEDGSWDTWYEDGSWWKDGNYIYIFDTQNNENLPVGNGGFARREKIFRIRAAYIYKKPDKEPGARYEVPGIENNEYLQNN